MKKIKLNLHTHANKRKTHTTTSLCKPPMGIPASNSLEGKPLNHMPEANHVPINKGSAVKQPSNIDVSN